MSVLEQTRASARWTLPAVTLGVACIIAGGLVAAISATAPSEGGAWTAAYLVLVGGVAQIALALGQAVFAARSPAPRVAHAQFAAWNLGNAGVIVGTLAGLVVLVALGGALLVLALLLALVITRGARGGWLLLGFRALIVIVLVSVPVGIVLAALGSG